MKETLPQIDKKWKQQMGSGLPGGTGQEGRPRRRQTEERCPLPWSQETRKRPNSDAAQHAIRVQYQAKLPACTLHAPQHPPPAELLSARWRTQHNRRAWGRQGEYIACQYPSKHQQGLPWVS